MMSRHKHKPLTLSERRKIWWDTVQSVYTSYLAFEIAIAVVFSACVVKFNQWNAANHPELVQSDSLLNVMQTISPVIWFGSALLYICALRLLQGVAKAGTYPTKLQVEVDQNLKKLDDVIEELSHRKKEQ